MRRLCPAALAALFLACSQTSLSPQVAPAVETLRDEGLAVSLGDGFPSLQDYHAFDRIF